MLLYQFSVREEDATLPSPFTQPLSASMVRRKDEQVKEKSHPTGKSKILAKYRKEMGEKEKAEHEAKKAPGNRVSTVI